MIKNIKINNIRNLTHIDLSLNHYNVFIGNNGSGKTSLLESIFLLSRGKSFRHFETKRYISHDATTCTIWATLGNLDNDTYDETIAIAKHKDINTPSQLRHNNTPLTSQAMLTKRLPVLLIDPSSMSILEEGTANRRQLLDFLCFHHTPNFYGAWLNYQRTLKQRNALLKSAQNLPTDSYAFTQLCEQIAAWDVGLSSYANDLNKIRKQVFDDWQAAFCETIHQLLPNHNTIHLGYQAGFDDQIELKQLLSERLLSDIELGYTRIGSHRADLSITITGTLSNGKSHKEQAINVLSRGEKKLLITALKLSGLPQLCVGHNLPIVLIDDIDSELDTQACQLLLKNLSTLPCQVLISSLDTKILNKLTQFIDSDKIATFAVNNGTITATANKS